MQGRTASPDHQTAARQAAARSRRTMRPPGGVPGSDPGASARTARRPRPAAGPRSLRQDSPAPRHSAAGSRRRRSCPPHHWPIAPTPMPPAAKPTPAARPADRSTTPVRPAQCATDLARLRQRQCAACEVAQDMPRRTGEPRRHRRDRPIAPPMRQQWRSAAASQIRRCGQPPAAPEPAARSLQTRGPAATRRYSTVPPGCTSQWPASGGSGRRAGRADESRTRLHGTSAEQQQGLAQHMARQQQPDCL